MLIFFFFFWPIYIPWTLNTGACIQKVDLFYSAGLRRNEKIGTGFGKNAHEWTRRVEISKEEIPGSKRSMYGYTLTYSRLQRENVFSPDGTLISASAAPHCGETVTTEIGTV